MEGGRTVVVQGERHQRSLAIRTEDMNSIRQHVFGFWPRGLLSPNPRHVLYFIACGNAPSRLVCRKSQWCNSSDGQRNEKKSYGAAHASIQQIQVGEPSRLVQLVRSLTANQDRGLNSGRIYFATPPLDRDV